MSIRNLVDQVAATVGSWQDVTVNPHRFGGQEFNLGNIEIGHIHRNGLVDIPFTRKIRDVLVAEGHSQPHHLLAESGWISYFIRSEDDVEGALWLYRLSFLHKRRGRARHDPAYAKELEHEMRNMNPSQALSEALGLYPEAQSP
jgi:hypothetical protein